MNKTAPSASELFRRRDRSDLCRGEAAMVVGTIAEGLGSRMAAAAKFDLRLVRIGWERIADCVDHRGRTFDDQRAVGTHMNRDGHEKLPAEG
jgi:hypothetical protein